MGNKHSTNKDIGNKSRGAKVDTNSRASFLSSPKSSDLESRVLNSKLGSKPASIPTTPTASSTNATTTTPTALPPKKPFDSRKCLAWFKTYTGLEEEEEPDADQIGPGGITKLCEDINVSLDAVDMLVLAYHLQADTMPIFTKEEWIKGMTKLGIDSTEKLRVKMPSLVGALQDPKHFKEFYRYVFMFAKDSEQKCMPLETACAMLGTVMKGRPHEKRFVAYLEAKRPVKVINKDQWYNFLDFSDSIAEDLSNYDPIGSAWPVLMDEYVEWRNEETL